MEGTNSKGRNISKGWGDGRDGRSEAQSFICASNALFIDNSIDRKSLQKYIIKLFGGPII